MVETGADVAPVPPTHVALPDGWAVAGPSSGMTTLDALAARLAEDRDAPPAAPAVVEALRADLDRGVRLAAWSARGVRGDRARLQEGNRVLDRGRRVVLATLTVSPDPAATSGEVVPIGPAREVVLPAGPARMSVGVREVAGGQVLEVSHAVDIGPAGMVLLGRTPNLALADVMVRTFHLIARSLRQPR